MSTLPDTRTPLLRSPVQKPDLENLGCLTELIGTWNSPPGSAATGYNVMPLPENDAAEGFVLKNFPYYEEITFAPIAGNAPNRGGDFTQVASTLFYEQRVFFADNPAPPDVPGLDNKLIHAENGSWLHLSYAPQIEGAYGPGTVNWPSPHGMQPQDTAYAKQVSVPHGNSILAVGQATPIAGGDIVFPKADRSTLPFTDSSTIDPNTKLAEQLQQLKQKGVSVTGGSRIDVATDPNKGGAVTNILFEQRRATVDWFGTTWFIEHLSDGTTQLQYSQTIAMKFLIRGKPTPFIHIDANTLTKVK